MKPNLKLLLTVSALFLSGELSAQTFKCKDATGRTTYSNMACGTLGLVDGGPIRDGLSISGDYRPPAAAVETPRTDINTVPANAATAAGATASAGPERRCSVVSTVNGNVVRCNDKPPE